MSKTLHFESQQAVEEVLKVHNILQGDGFEKLREEFLASLKIKGGKVAHMYYAAVKGVLDEKDFFTLLGQIGIGATTFFAFKDHKCGGPGFSDICIFSKGDYCNTDLCTGH